MDLFRCRAKLLKNNELCVVDTTSRSAWNSSLTDIHYGNNKDKLPLPQTMEVVAYTLSQHMPIYYRTLLGSTPDSRSLVIILSELKNMGFKDVVMITDRGYESIHNLEMYVVSAQ